MTPDKTPTEALSQLRHLYANLTNGGVRDTASAKRIAEGLLSPAIAALERRGSPVVAGEPVAWRLKDEEASRHYGKEIYVYYGKEDFQEGVDPCDFIAGIEALTTPTPTQPQAGAVPMPKFLALKFHARRDKKATVTLLFNDHETADAWVRGIKGGQHGTDT